MIQNNVKDKPKKAEDLVAQFNTDGSDVKILFPNTCNLQAISCDLTSLLATIEADAVKYESDLLKAKTEKEKQALVNPVIVQLYDGSMPVIKVNRKKLQEYIDSLKETSLKGSLVYDIPRFEFSLKIDLKIEHDLRSKGDVKGLIFWIDGKPITI